MTSLPVARRVREQDLAGFERAITDAALAGAGWPELLVRLYDATGCHCRLVDPLGEALAATDDGPGLSSDQIAGAAEPRSTVIAEDGWPASAVPAVAGDRIAAIVLLAEPASTRQLAFARAAVTALLIESVRRTATGASRFDDGTTLIAALRRGTGIAESAVTAAARFGLDLGAAHCAAALRYTGTHHRTWATAVAWLERPVERNGSLAFTLVTDAADLAQLRARLERAAGDGAVLAACGSRTAEPRRYRESFDEAVRLLDAVARSGGQQLSFTDAGLLQVLLAVPPERLRAFVDRHLGPVLGRPELLATLQLWLASGGSRQAVSEQLHLHRNSVGYRVGQLKALLGVDPLDPEHGAVLHAALAARELVESPLSERVLTAR